MASFWIDWYEVWEMSFVLSHSMKVQWMSWTILQIGDWAQMLRPVLPGHHLRAVWCSHVSWAAIVTGDCWFIDNSFIQGLLIHSQFNFRDPLKINPSSRWTLRVTCRAISDVSDWSLGFRLNCTAAWHRTAVWLLLLYGVLTVAWLWILQGQRAGINDFALIGLVSCVLSLFISSMTCFLYIYIYIYVSSMTIEVRRPVWKLQSLLRAWAGVFGGKTQRWWWISWHWNVPGALVWIWDVVSRSVSNDISWKVVDQICFVKFVLSLLP